MHYGKKTSLYIFAMICALVEIAATEDVIVLGVDVDAPAGGAEVEDGEVAATEETGGAGTSD